MFGTVARLKVKPGKGEELLAHGEKWSRERGSVSGEVASYLFKLEGRQEEYLLVGIFKDREAYFDNANHPDTDRLYREMRELLESDPEWNDGEVMELPVVAGI
ncbi:MAG TPA: antibiotic biosynthesis monooxygenase [Thermomicrobiales bacterium]|nr:antibiotic biosynthesis monooxygenase [Thermomicrobiales bacterium]